MPSSFRRTRPSSVSTEALERFQKAILSSDVCGLVALLQDCPALIHHGHRSEDGSWMHVAVRADQADAARFLIERGCSLETRGKGWMTPVAYGLQHGSARCVAVLLEAGASPHYSGVSTGMPLLHMSIDAPDHGASVRLLVAHGADLEAKAGGLTALYWAAKKGLAEKARILLAAGARTDWVASRRGEASFLDFARRSGSDEMLALAHGWLSAQTAQRTICGVSALTIKPLACCHRP